MIITKTPFRMSFFGGGTDIPEFFREHGGAVLSTTFDKYCYVNVRHLPRFFDYTTELSYSRIERVTSPEQIEHPAVRNAMKMLDMREIRLTYEADLPARSGLGTSSSFAVGMLNAFYALKGKYADKKKLADEAIYLERTLCNEAGGWQDQIAASFGGLNRINFRGNDYEVLPVIISPERKEMLNNRLLWKLFFRGKLVSPIVHKDDLHTAVTKTTLEVKLPREVIKIMKKEIGYSETCFIRRRKDNREWYYLQILKNDIAPYRKSEKESRSDIIQMFVLVLGVSLALLYIFIRHLGL